MTFPIIVPIAGPSQNHEILRQLRILQDYFSSSQTSTGAGSISSAFTIVNSSSTTTQTLPPASENTGRSLTIKNRGNGLITVSPQGSSTIDGKSAAHIY